MYSKQSKVYWNRSKPHPFPQQSKCEIGVACKTRCFPPPQLKMLLPPLRNITLRNTPFFEAKLFLKRCTCSTQEMLCSFLSTLLQMQNRNTHHLNVLLQIEFNNFNWNIFICQFSSVHMHTSRSSEVGSGISLQNHCKEGLEGCSMEPHSHYSFFHPKVHHLPG